MNMNDLIAYPQFLRDNPLRTGPILPVQPMTMPMRAMPITDITGEQIKEYRRTMSKEEEDELEMVMDEDDEELDVEANEREDMDGSETSSAISAGVSPGISPRLSPGGSVPAGSPNSQSSSENSSMSNSSISAGSGCAQGLLLTEKRHTCEICNKAFPYLSILESHKRCHTGEKPFSCHFCDKKFAQKATLQVHERTHTGERPYKCRYCEKTFAQYGTKTVHEKSAHLGIRNYKCPLCDKCLSSPSALYTHKKTHGEKKFPCLFCPKTFTLKNYLKLHVKQVHEQNEKKHNCKFCDKSFAYAGSLQVHVRTHTGERPYICKFCPKAFASQGNLQSHERTHTGERPYNCVHCDRSFIQKSQLTAHEATHTEGGEEPVVVVTPVPEPVKKATADYECKFCGKRYPYASSLYIHTRQHTGERPFSCQFCDKAFTNQGNMQVHQRTHTGEKPYSCSACGKSYAQKVGLKIHLEQCAPYLEGEHLLNVDTDSDCSDNSSNRNNKLAMPNIYADAAAMPDCSPRSSTRSLSISSSHNSSFKPVTSDMSMLNMPGSAIGFQPVSAAPITAFRQSTEMPPADFGQLASAPAPYQSELIHNEATSAFHPPTSKSDTSLLLDQQIAALRGLLDASLPPLLSPSLLSQQLLTSQLLFQLQNQDLSSLLSSPLLSSLPTSLTSTPTLASGGLLASLLPQNLLTTMPQHPSMEIKQDAMIV